jgi:hypothetical protein
MYLKDTRRGISLLFVFVMIMVLNSIHQDATAQVANPCCTITSIDYATRIVTATEISTGKKIEFRQIIDKPNEIGLHHREIMVFLKNLNIGQPVFVDNLSRRVSIDGSQPCCIIIHRNLNNVIR